MDVKKLIQKFRY